MPGCSVNDLCPHFDMSRIGVMKHLTVLVEAGLIISRKAGRTRKLYFNAVPIQLIYDRWTTEYAGFWAGKMADVKYAVEQPAKRRAGHARRRATDLEDPDPRPNRGRVA
jgi:predicted transcriptional regulator